MYHQNIPPTQEGTVMRNLMAWNSMHNTTISGGNVLPFAVPIVGQQITIINANATIQPVIAIPTQSVDFFPLSAINNQVTLYPPFQPPIAILSAHQQSNNLQEPVELIDLTKDDNEGSETQTTQTPIRPIPLKPNFHNMLDVESINESACLTTFHRNENNSLSERDLSREVICLNKTPKKSRLTFHPQYYKPKPTNNKQNSMEKYFKPLPKETKVLVLPPGQSILENISETKPFIHQDYTHHQQCGDLSDNSAPNSLQQSDTMEFSTQNHDFETQPELIENKYSIEKDADQPNSIECSPFVEMIPNEKQFLDSSQKGIESCQEEAIVLDDNKVDENVSGIENNQERVILDGECSETRRLFDDMKFVKESELVFLHDYMIDTLFAHIDKKLVIVKHRAFMKFLIDDDKTPTPEIAQTCFDTLLRKVLSSVDGDKTTTKMNVCIRHPSLRYGRKYFEGVTYDKFNGENIAWHVIYLHRCNPMFEIDCDFKIQVDVGISNETDKSLNRRK